MHLGGLLETDCSPRGSDSVALEQLRTSGMYHFSKPTMLLIQGVLGPTLRSNDNLSTYVSRPGPRVWSPRGYSCFLGPDWDRFRGLAPVVHGSQLFGEATVKDSCFGP